MVKIGNKDAYRLVPSLDAALESPSSSSDLVDSSENEMDSSSDSTTPRSGSSDWKEGRSANTSPRRRRFKPSSPTGTKLKPELNASGDAGGSSSSPTSSGALDLEGVPPLATPVATDDTITIRRSDSLLDDNGLATSSCAGRSPSVDNDGASNGVSIGDLGFVLVSPGSQGSSGGASGGRRSASNDQFSQREGQRRMYAPRNNRRYEVGSSSRQQAGPGQQWRRVGGPNIQIPSHFFRRPPGFLSPVPPPPPPPWSALPPGFAAGGLQVQLGRPVQAPVYHLYASPSMYPPFEVATVVPARRSSGLYPPPGVTIRHPPPASGDPPLPEPPARTCRVTITAPPPDGGRRASAATEGADKQRPAPVTRAPTTFSWPPVAEEDALFTQRLYGPSCRSRRLPVFEDICPGDEPSQSPPPPPPPSQPPPPPPSSPPPPPPSQPPPPPPPPPPSQPPPPPPPPPPSQPPPPPGSP